MIKPDTISEHFSRQAAEYAVSLSHASGNDLDIVEGLAEVQVDEVCLDIATGAGHTAFRIARRSRFVIGLDLAPGMTKEAARLAREQEISNVLFLRGDAHDLPFPDKSFSLVTCRIAPHHFRDVAGAMHEVKRVLDTNGRFILEDSLLPDDPDEAAFIDDVDKRRDPTHVHRLSSREWEHILLGAELEIKRVVIYPKSRNYKKWLQRAGLPNEMASGLTEHILSTESKVRDKYFQVANTTIKSFRDEKYICRAEPAR